MVAKSRWPCEAGAAGANGLLAALGARRLPVLRQSVFIVPGELRATLGRQHRHLPGSVRCVHRRDAVDRMTGVTAYCCSVKPDRNLAKPPAGEPTAPRLRLVVTVLSAVSEREPNRVSMRGRSPSRCVSGVSLGRRSASRSVPSSVASISLRDLVLLDQHRNGLGRQSAPLLVRFLFRFRVHGEDAHVAQDLAGSRLGNVLALAEVAEDVHAVTRIDQARYGRVHLHFQAADAKTFRNLDRRPVNARWPVWPAGSVRLRTTERGQTAR